MAKNSVFTFVLFFVGIIIAYAQPVCGIDRVDQYLPRLMGKKVGVVCNQTSITNQNIHLVDFLVAENVDVTAIFSPEHGFRGAASAGEKILDDKDKKTGLPIYSLHGKTKKPTPKMLANLDVLVFDIQDVGVRFYTYISTLSLVMEACAEANIPLIVLDRPNPNAGYVDGPVLKSNFKSFVGMHPVPVVYGLTIGEYANMVNGEYWLADSAQCNLQVVEIAHYTHADAYELPVAPSPNLQDAAAIRLYPSLCFFEGTSVSIGRGTNKPFRQIGAPWLKPTFENYYFVPQPNSGAKNPKYAGDTCYGVDLTKFANGFLPSYSQLYLYWLLDAYQLCPSKDQFFSDFFDVLAGTDMLRKQIIAGYTEIEIRESWSKDLKVYQQIRAKYLLYPDL